MMMSLPPPRQVVDDILDFTQTSEQLGKPQGQDLASGNLTAPVIFALQKSPELVSGEVEHSSLGQTQSDTDQCCLRHDVCN